MAKMIKMLEILADFTEQAKKTQNISLALSEFICENLSHDDVLIEFSKEILTAQLKFSEEISTTFDKFEKYQNSQL